MALAAVSDLFDILVRRMTPTYSEFARARRHRDEVVHRLRLPGYVGYENTGSYIKRTCIRPFADVDIIVGFDSDEYSGNTDRIITKLRFQLAQSFPTSVVRTQTHSVGIVFADGFRVDAVPALAHKTKPGYWRVRNRDDGRWVSTNVALHKQFFEKRQSEDPRFRDMVKLAKHWKTSRRRKYGSFMIELLVAKAFERGIPHGRDVALHNFFEWLSSGGLDKPVIFRDYYNASEAPASNDPLVVLDPTNPANNVAATVEREALDELRSAADSARARSGTALQAGSRAQAASIWREILPSFPLR
jgi:tRNA nucleotidyltransferase (CCA-adding enzyme)